MMSNNVEKKRTQDQEVVSAAMRLAARLSAAREFQQQAAILKGLDSPRFQILEEREEYVREMLPIVRMGNEAGLLSQEESIYLRSYFLDALAHESRWLEGLYQDKLEPISKAIEEIEKRHGLKPDEFWLRDQGPQEWQDLNSEYESVLDSYRPLTYREFGEEELATLLEADAEHFKALREAGRRAVFELASPLDSLYSLISTYQRESRLCAEVGAYYAACGTLGAALEALLLALCYQYPQQSENARQRLPKNLRPKKSDPDCWSLSNLVNIASRAGWLPIFKVGSEELDTADWVHLIRSLRNLLHPSNHLRNRPRVQIGEQEYEDAYAVYVLVEVQLGWLESELRQTE
jgi:hypothetical protein